MTDEHEHAGNNRTESRDRVEFRVWNPSAASVKKLKGHGIPSGCDERRDVYLVGPDGTVNAKLRNSALEVKRLVDTVGVLERWAPDPPAELPLTGEQLDGLLSDLGIASRGNEHWSDRDLSDPALAVSNAPNGHVVPVQKQRQRYEIGGIRAEFTAATFFDETHVSIAVEAAESEPVRRVISELDLRGENRAMHQAASDEARQIHS